MTCLSQQMGSLAGGSSAALLHRARRERALACDQPAVCMADPSMSGTAGQALGATPAREYQSKEGRAVKVKGPLFRGGACVVTNPALRGGGAGVQPPSLFSLCFLSFRSLSHSVRAQADGAR